MTPTSSNPSDPAGRLFDLVADALALAADERAAFLAAACAGDAALLAEARELLGHEAGARTFLETLAFTMSGGAPGASDAGELAPGTWVGECEVVRFLGQGGMGEVYLARDTKLERPVAVKLLKRSLDDQTLLRRFRHERRVLAALTHPNIARLYGGDTTPEGRRYLVMEYVEGERLDRFCRTRGSGVPERLALFRQVCAAVAYAHQNLVVHRDLKPANIFVTPEGAPKLLDFGVAKLLDVEGATHIDPTLTMPAAMTPEYASPEQVKGEPITTASDVYSLGVVLFELLTGQRPFAHLKGRRPDELARAICEEAPPRPSTVAGQAAASSLTAAEPTGLAVAAVREAPAKLRRLLAGDLDNIVAKALRKEPARRYPSVLALSEDLRRHCEGLPVSARKDTLGYRAGKFVRRNKAGVAAAALLMLAVLGGLVATARQARIARQERDLARLAQGRALTAQKQAEHTSDFLQKILFKASPMMGGGKDVKVVQVLDGVGATMDQELASEPDVLAQMHGTLGRTYMSLGLDQAAARHYRQSVEQFRRLHGEEDERTVNAELYFANYLSLTYQFDEADPLLRHVANWLRGQPKVDDKRLVLTLLTLSFDLSLSKQPTEADQAANEALTRAAKAAGEDSSLFASTLANLGTVRRGQGRSDEAAAAYRQALDILGRKSPDETNVVTDEFDLCNILFDQGKFAEAESLLARARQDCRRIFGDGDNVFAAGLSFYFVALEFERRDFAKAATEGGKALERMAATFPDSHSLVISLRYMVGASLTQTGHASEGEPLLRRALAANGKPGSFGAFFFLFGNPETALGDCLLAQQRYAEAEPLLLTGYDRLNKDRGVQDPLTIQASTRLRDLYTAWNKPGQAARFAGAHVALPAARTP